MPRRAIFDEWAEPILVASNREGGDYVALRAWLRSVFDTAGPIPVAELEQRFIDRQLAIAREAVDLVMHDVVETTDLRPEVVVDIYPAGNSLRIAVDGSSTTPSMMEIERSAAIAEVADYLQEHIAERLWRTWPVCERHGFGAHARVVDGEAVWDCTRFDHTLARVGDLRT